MTRQVEGENNDQKIWKDFNELKNDVFLLTSNPRQCRPDLFDMPFKITKILLLDMCHDEISQFGSLVQ